MKFEEAITAIYDAAEDAIDLAEPRTSINRFRRRVERLAASVSGAEFLAFLRDAADAIAAAPADASMAWAELVREAKQQASEDPRYSLLLRFAAEQSVEIPNLALAAWSSYSPVEHSENILVSASYLKLCEETRGETRAAHTMVALQNIACGLYPRYLECLVAAAHASASTPVPPHEKFGVLVDQAQRVLEPYPGLLHPEIVMFRNASAHGCRSPRGNAGDWTYDDEADSVTVWDSSAHSHTTSAAELVERARAIWRLAGSTFSRVRDLLVCRWMATALPPASTAAFMRAMISPEASNLDEAVREFETAFMLRLLPARQRIQELQARRQAELAERALRRHQR